MSWNINTHLKTIFASSSGRSALTWRAPQAAADWLRPRSGWNPLTSRRRSRRWLAAARAGRSAVSMAAAPTGGRRRLTEAKLSEGEGNCLYCRRGWKECVFYSSRPRWVLILDLEEECRRERRLSPSRTRFSKRRKWTSEAGEPAPRRARGSAEKPDCDGRCVTLNGC